MIIFPSLIDISLKQENLPLIFDDGETTDYVIGQNHILTPQITIKKNKLSLLFNSTGKGNIQNEKIILRYPNCYELNLKNFLKFFIKKSYIHSYKK